MVNTPCWLVRSVFRFTYTFNCCGLNGKCKQARAVLLSLSVFTILPSSPSPPPPPPSLQGSHQPGVRGRSRDQRSSAEEKGTRAGAIAGEVTSAERTSVAGSYSGGEREEASLDIQLPLRVLFIARPLQLVLSSAFHCLRREGKQRERERE